MIQHPDLQNFLKLSHEYLHTFMWAMNASVTIIKLTHPHSCLSYIQVLIFVNIATIADIQDTKKMLI